MNNPRYIIIRYYFLGFWEIGAPVVLRHGSIDPDVIGGFAKHGLPWVFRPLFMANVVTSDELPPEYQKLL